MSDPIERGERAKAFLANGLLRDVLDGLEAQLGQYRIDRELGHKRYQIERELQLKQAQLAAELRLKATAPGYQSTSPIRGDGVADGVHIGGEPG